MSKVGERHHWPETIVTLEVFMVIDNSSRLTGDALGSLKAREELMRTVGVPSPHIYAGHPGLSTGHKRKSNR